MKRNLLNGIALAALVAGSAMAQTATFGPAPALPADMAPAPPQAPLPAPVLPAQKETEARALASSTATKDAADAIAHNKAAPIPEGALEVTASGTLEWLRQDQMYVARQNAVARHNDVTLKGDLLVAHYQVPPGKKSGTEITLVTAEGNPVEVIAPSAVAYGKHGTYDVNTHLIELTGDNLKLVTTDEVITAKDKLQYFEDKDTGVAIGDAVLVRSDGDKLTADTISAKFVHAASADDKKGAKPAAAPVAPVVPTVDTDGNPVKAHSLEHLDAVGHVVLVTQTDIVTGDAGTYNPITDITTVTGNVRVTREENQLDGDHAEVDMATGISRVFAAPNGKVHALFVPKKKDAKDKTASNQSSNQPGQDQ